MDPFILFAKRVSDIPEDWLLCQDSQDVEPVLEHGTCKCNDPKERARMRKEWGYKDKDFRKAGLIE